MASETVRCCFFFWILALFCVCVCVCVCGTVLHVDWHMYVWVKYIYICMYA